MKNTLLIDVMELAGPEVGKGGDVGKGSRIWAEPAKGGWPLPGRGRNWSEAGQGCELTLSAQLIPEDQYREQSQEARTCSGSSGSARPGDACGMGR